MITPLLPANMIAYHVGPRRPDRALRSDMRAGGEGMWVLGPGRYLVTSQDVARLYAKYTKEPRLYRVEVDTSGLYDPQKGQPVGLRGPLVKLAAEVAESRGVRRLPPGQPLEHGRGTVGDLVRALGPVEARRRLAGVGVLGCYEQLPNGSFEIACYWPERQLRVLEEAALVESRALEIVAEIRAVLGGE